MHVRPSTQAVASSDDVTERAQSAVAAFRHMQHSLTSYARAITGSRKVRVEVSSGPPRTDGNIIFYRPPIALGDKTRHDRSLCDERDESGLKACPACRIREEVLVNIYHEIAHIAFGSFADGTNYMQVAARYNPFLPYLFNCLEDSRVDSSMFEARKGTRKMLQADTFNLLREGVPDDRGELHKSADAPMNAQMSLATYLEAAGYQGWDAFMHPQVGRDVKDARVQQLLSQVRQATSAKEIYNVASPVLARLRELGYFLSPEEQAERSQDQQDDEKQDDEKQDDEKQDDEKQDDENDSDGEPEDRDREPDDGAGSDDTRADAESTEEGEDVSEQGDSARGWGDSAEAPDEGGEPNDSEGTPGGDEAPGDNVGGSGEQDGDPAAGGGDIPGDGASGQGEPAAGEPQGDPAEGDDQPDAEQAGASDGGLTRDEHDQPEAGDEPSSDGPDSEDDRPHEVMESGADEGKGGVEVDDQSKPRYGNEHDVKAALEYGHPHLESGDKIDIEGTDEEKAAVAVAVVQGLYFETSSIGVRQVYEHTYAPDAKGWDSSQYDDDEKLWYGITCDMDISEKVLGPALLKTRRIFSDNKVSAYQPNLRSGRVNGKVLGKRAWSDDDRLFDKKRVPAKQDYAVLIMLDISCSNLGDNLALLKRSVFTQAELCQRVGIKFAIVAHSASIERLGDDATFAMHLHHVKEWDEPWTTDIKQRVGDLVGVGGNLDGHAMEYGRKMLSRVTATDKILMYFTDGKMPAANHEEELEVLQRQIKLCKRDHITLMGVGMRTDSPVRHGLDTVQINDDDDLVKVVNHLGKKLQQR